MSLNFLGLGASIGIKDLGATKTAEGLSSAFGSVASKLAAVGSGGLTAALGVGALISAGTKSLGPMADALTNMTVGTHKFTTEFEATAQAHSVSTRKIIGQTGMLGSALNKANAEAAGMAHGMGFSDETAGHAVASFAQFNKELKAFGIDSAITGAKLEDGLGIQIRDLSLHVRRMKTEFKLSDKELGEVSKMLTGVGEAVHDMQGPFKALPELMDLATKRSNLMAQHLSDIGGVDVIKSVGLAQKALFDLGLDSQRAQKAAIGLETSMAKSMEGFGDMFAGTESDLGPFLAKFSIVGGSVQDAFKAARKGPAEFLKSMAVAVGELREKGGDVGEFLTMFGGQMRSVFGEETTDALIGALKDVDKAKASTINTTKILGKDIKKVADDVWRSGKTLQDSYDMMVGAGMASFRQIGIGAAKAFITDTGAAFKSFNAQAKDLVKKGGPLGAIVEKISEMSSLGAISLIPQAMRPAIGVFGQLYTAVSPSLGAITQVTGALTGMLNPATLLAGALGGLVGLIIKNKTETNNWGDAVVAAFGDVKEFVDTWTQKLLKWANDFDWKKVFTLLADGLADGIKGFTTVLGSIGRETTAGIEGIATPGKDAKLSFGGVGGKIFGALKDSFSKQPWGDIIHNLFSAMAGAKDRLITEVSNLLKDIFDSTPEETWKSIGQSVGKGLTFVLGEVVSYIESSAETQSKINDLLYTIGKGMIKALPALYDGFVKGMSQSTTGTIIMYLLSPTEALADLSLFMQNIGASIATKMGEIWNNLKKKTMEVWDELFGHSIVPDMVEKGFKEIGDTVERFVSFVENSVVGRVVNAFSGVVSKVKGLFGGGGDSPSGLIGGDMSDSLKVVTGAVDKMKDYIQKVLFESVSVGISKAFAETFKNITEGSKDFFKVMGDAFRIFTDKVGNLFRQMWIDVLDDTALAAQSAGKTIGSALSELQNLKDALSQVQSIRGALSKEGTDSAGRMERKKESDSDWLIKKIDHPDWYFLDYQGRFDNGISRLVDAIGTSARGSSTGAGDSNAASSTANALRRRLQPPSVAGNPLVNTGLGTRGSE